MDDNQLLLMSAHALGIQLEYRRGSDAYYYNDQETGREQWLPLDDLGQATRMALRLKIGLDVAGPHPAAVFFHPRHAKFTHFREVQDEQGMESAVCRAFTRAAAEIGKHL